MYYNNIQEVQTQYYIQKKIDYGRLIGYFKKVLDYSLEDNDQKNLDDIILDYISEQQAKRQAKIQSEMENVLKEHRNNKIKLSDRCVYNVDDVKALIKHNCKGRPAIK
ncbi:7368_t:CDS:1 [Funneliformis caledonium]|uniref:7368_t:CDS:1 n=1 Tax=Funneliformis caledonium TaxID=1117310 RepID=A0A9N9FEL6_9GLOM|nr:7368_t:CDS:1 [Funneliformis caledonium]